MPLFSDEIIVICHIFFDTVQVLLVFQIILFKKKSTANCCICLIILKMFLLQVRIVLCCSHSFHICVSLVLLCNSPPCNRFRALSSLPHSFYVLCSESSKVNYQALWTCSHRETGDFSKPLAPCASYSIKVPAFMLPVDPDLYSAPRSHFSP